MGQSVTMLISIPDRDKLKRVAIRDRAGRGEGVKVRKPVMLSGKV